MRLPKEILHGTIKAYVLGFILSLILTLAAWFVVDKHLLADPTLFILILAFAQLFVQLICFFHLTKETKPRWHLLIFLAMVFIIAIVVGGSLWIMQNLDSRMM